MHFERARARFLKQLEEVPEASEAVRIQHLARMSRVAEARNSIPLVATVLEEIAKEMGGLFTN